MDPSFTVGIEEEYLLVDIETRDLITEAPPSMLPACEKKLAGQVTAEFLQSQIEVGTRVCGTLGEAREDLAYLRRTVSEIASEHGLAIIAASTHPFANWETQQHTPKERYDNLARDLRGVVRRLMISGMHVHVAIEEEDLRIDLLDQVSYILPHLLALSTSSPFWKGEDSGLKSYRLAVWDAMPRTGFPEHFDSYGEFQRHVEVLVRAGLLEDSTKLWWDVRPSARFPTLEMRITDVCTRLEDTICVAALYRCWLRMLYRLRKSNQRWRRYSRLLLNENRWLAQRHGFEKGLVDFGRGTLVPYQELAEEMLGLIHEDAEYLGCVEEVSHVRTILERGTSAHQQLQTYETAVASGRSTQEALQAVVDKLIQGTLHGV